MAVLVERLLMALVLVVVRTVGTGMHGGGRGGATAEARRRVKERLWEIWGREAATARRGRRGDFAKRQRVCPTNKAPQQTGTSVRNGRHLAFTLCADTNNIFSARRPRRALPRTRGQAHICA